MEDKTYQKVFVQRLNKLMKENDVMQKDLAKHIGITRESIYRYKSGGGGCPNINILAQMADFFNVSTDYLLGRDEEDYKKDFCIQELQRLKDYLKTVNKEIEIEIALITDEIKTYKEE